MGIRVSSGKVIFASLFVVSACTSSLDGAAISSEHEPRAADEASFLEALAGGKADDGSMEPDTSDELPYEITAKQLDENGEVVEAALSCGLSIRSLEESTSYWIRNCNEPEMAREVISLNYDVLSVGETHVIMAYSAVSGSVRGRVLRMRRPR